MKVLHLFSNWKFTGPADPALVLARALAADGVEITFAAGRTPRAEPGADPIRGVMEIARDRGLTTIEGLTLSKHGRPLPWFRDVRTLRGWLSRGAFDVVHTHLPNDHHIATTAARANGIPVVRSLYELEAPTGRRARSAFRRTAALFPPTARAAENLRRAFPQLASQIEVAAPVLDLDRFTTTRAPEMRERWGVPSDRFVIGVVARMQLHRRFPELIEGFARAAREDEGLHLVILGRGTNQRIVAHEPAAASGVGDRIHFPGYVDPSEYPGALPAFDALIFLVPGSDGTCRALRETQACGVPVITSTRGLIPELVAPEESALLLEEDSPAAIAAAITRLRNDPKTRDRLAAGASAFARTTFDPTAAAAHALAAYERLVAAGGSTR